MSFEFSIQLLGEKTETIIIDANAPSVSAKSYGALKAEVHRRYHLLETNPLYVNLCVKGTGEEVADALPLDAARNNLMVQPKNVRVLIRDRDKCWPSVVSIEEERENPEQHEAASVSVLDTIAQLKSTYSRDMGEKLDKLTFRGEMLLDHKRVCETTLFQEAIRLTHIRGLQGRISVIISDTRSERQTRLDDLYHNQSIAEVKALFATNERRVNIEAAALKVHDGELLADDTTLYAADIYNDALLDLETPAFTVTIKEQVSTAANAAGVEIIAYDHFKTYDLKAAYNGIVTTNQLLEGDTLVYNNEIISEDAELYKLRMKKDAVIYINREDTTLARFDYICADCGNNVKLKKTDAVRCRDCGHRILFKKRTTRLCQYLAR